VSSGTLNLAQLNWYNCTELSDQLKIRSMYFITCYLVLNSNGFLTYILLYSSHLLHTKATCCGQAFVPCKVVLNICILVLVLSIY